MMGATSLENVGTLAGAAYALDPTASDPTSRQATRLMQPPCTAQVLRRAPRSLAHLGAGAHEGDTIVTEVILTRLMGVALMNRPLITTVWSRCAGRLNSDTPISLKAFLPAGALV